MNNIENFFLSDSLFAKRTTAGLDWLKHSIDVTGVAGSAAYFRPLYGWQKAYPETTGYIISTLLNYHKIYPNQSLEKYALNSADWICKLQFKNGALPGGYVDSKDPSVFNTGQMLIGLIAAFEHTKNQKYLTVINDAVLWLISILEKDGSWKLGAYVDGWVPSYYTRVIWPILWANTHLKNELVETKMKYSLLYYQEKITKKLEVKDWAFKAGQKAFTHTIAYTIRGFLESAILLNDPNLLDISFGLGEKIMKLREVKGKLAGWYDNNWDGDYWFTCLTGNAQLSIILSRMYQISGDLRYINTSLKIFGDVVDKQVLSNNKNTNGALPGSSPFYGRYLIFRYPNWATKFYLDAYLLLKTELDQITKTKLAEHHV